MVYVCIILLTIRVQRECNVKKKKCKVQFYLAIKSSLKRGRGGLNILASPSTDWTSYTNFS